MKAIVAVDREWGIGYRGDLLARVRADLMHFRDLTLGKTVILGSKTLATFPNGTVLKNRKNIILSKNPAFIAKGGVVVHSLEELSKELKHHPVEDVMVIGGASVYHQLLPFCDTVYVTRFDHSFEKDAYFPNLDQDPAWELSKTGEEQTSDPGTDSIANLKFSFTTYIRKS
ncbi:MAG TPA: diacylglycerol kinase [Clostridiales bacterium]|nr:diacylglycerol kinase [Clostridiales bacterium]HBE14391.1 diacylglycerol kinase [Clostridiales bacterium]HCG35437.1 diacylglycerol kinase [Clostridiales bacterium]